MPTPPLIESSANVSAAILVTSAVSLATLHSSSTALLQVLIPLLHRSRTVAPPAVTGTNRQQVTPRAAKWDTWAASAACNFCSTYTVDT